MRIGGHAWSPVRTLVTSRIVIIVCKAGHDLTSVTAVPTVWSVMNTLAHTAGAPSALDLRVDAAGRDCAFVSYLDYAYFYFYPLSAGGT